MIEVAATTDMPIIEARDVSKQFVRKLDLAGRIAAHLGSGQREETVHGVDRVSLTIGKGEVVGLVGESGCGKSTLGRMIAGLMPTSEGTILVKGRERGTLKSEDARAMRLAIQMIFQDPSTALNPRARVEQIIGEAPVVHGLTTAGQRSSYVAEMLERVGLDPAMMRRYPHQFSGGQRARIGIARALAVKPEFVVCDEAIAALDVSIQAQVINLFMDLREAYDLTYLFISHDLGVVRHIADRVVIMYLGRIVETGPTEELFASPKHPYAQALLAEMPRITAERRKFEAISGEIPSPLHPPTGCHFHPRCPRAMPRCSAEQPALREISPGRLSACHLYD